jgi:hypothetical protein
LQLALARAPVTITLELRRLNGEILQCELPFPDEVSAVVLKSLATTVRSKDTDTADVWRCLEIAFAAGLGPADFTRGAYAHICHGLTRPSPCVKYQHTFSTGCWEPSQLVL